MVPKYKRGKNGEVVESEDGMRERNVKNDRQHAASKDTKFKEEQVQAETGEVVFVEEEAVYKRPRRRVKPDVKYGKIN